MKNGYGPNTLWRRMEWQMYGSVCWPKQNELVKHVKTKEQQSKMKKRENTTTTAAQKLPNLMQNEMACWIGKEKQIVMHAAKMQNPAHNWNAQRGKLTTEALENDTWSCYEMDTALDIVSGIWCMNGTDSLDQPDAYVNFEYCPCCCCGCDVSHFRQCSSFFCVYAFCFCCCLQFYLDPFLFVIVWTNRIDIKRFESTFATNASQIVQQTQLPAECILNSGLSFFFLRQNLTLTKFWRKLIETGNWADWYLCTPLPCSVVQFVSGNFFCCCSIL